MSHVDVGGYFPDGCEIVDVDGPGGVSYQGQKVFVSKSVVRCQVGLERVDGGEIRVWFHRQLLGFFRAGQGAGEVPVTPYPEPDLFPAVAPSAGAGMLPVVGSAAVKDDTGGDTGGDTRLRPASAASNGEVSNGAKDIAPDTAAGG